MATKKESVVREAFAETLDFLAHKVRHGTMTYQDVEAIMELMASEGGVSATVSDLSRFYSQSEDNIRHVLHRKVSSPPVRRVYYDFAAFQKGVPEKWHKKSSIPND